MSKESGTEAGEGGPEAPLSPRLREGREWLASRAKSGELKGRTTEAILDELARETGVVVPKTDSVVIMLTLQRLAAEEAYARQIALAEAQADVVADFKEHEAALASTAAALSEVVEKLVTGIRDAFTPAVTEERGPKGEQLLDRDHPGGLKKGMSVDSLVKALFEYRAQRDTMKAELEALKAKPEGGKR